MAFFVKVGSSSRLPEIGELKFAAKENTSATRTVTTFNQIIDLHIQGYVGSWQKIQRSKSTVLESLRLTLGG